MEAILPLIIQLIAGGAGGNIVGQVAKNISLGPAGNSAAGGIGGLIGSWLISHFVGPGAADPMAMAAIIQSLRAQGADDIIVFVGGVIPPQDYEFLYDAGVKGIYGPGTPIPASAKDVLEQIKANLARKP